MGSRSTLQDTVRVLRETGSYHLTKRDCICIKPVRHVFVLQSRTALDVEQVPVSWKILMARCLASYSLHTAVTRVAARRLRNLMHLKSDAIVTVYPIQANASMVNLEKKIVTDIAPQRAGPIGPSKVGSHGLRIVIQSCNLSLQDPTARIEDLIYRSLIAVCLTIDLQPWADH